MAGFEKERLFKSECLYPKRKTPKYSQRPTSAIPVHRELAVWILGSNLPEFVRGNEAKSWVLHVKLHTQIARNFFSSLGTALGLGFGSRSRLHRVEDLNNRCGLRRTKAGGDGIVKIIHKVGEKPGCSY